MQLVFDAILIAKNTDLSNKSKDWSTRNQESVYKWDMSTHVHGLYNRLLPNSIDHFHDVQKTPVVIVLYTEKNITDSM
jgi:hypothetical protein